MAKANQPKAKETKAKAPKKAKEEITNASVGPVDGTLETEPEELAMPEKPVKPSKKNDKALQDIAKLFTAIKEILTDINKSAKPHRTIRWALKSLDAAHDAVKIAFSRNS